MVEHSEATPAQRAQAFHDALACGFPRLMRQRATTGAGITTLVFSGGGDTQPLTARVLPFIFLILNCYFLSGYASGRRRAVVWTGCSDCRSAGVQREV